MIYSRWSGHTDEERAARRKAMKAAKDARYHARYRERRLAKMNEYYAENREVIREYQSVHRNENRDRINAGNREWQEANRDRVRARNREYSKNNREKFATFARARRARKRNAAGGHTVEEIAALWVTQKSQCACCSKRVTKKTAHIDHIVPLALGGSDYVRNLQILCAPCNLSKGAKDPLSFMQSRGYLL